MFNGVLHKVHNGITFESSKTSKTKVACKKKNKQIRFCNEIESNYEKNHFILYRFKK